MAERINYIVDIVATKLQLSCLNTVMTLSFWADRYWQRMQTQIGLLLEAQSDQGLHCLLFHLRLFDTISLRFGIFVRILGSLQQSSLACDNLGALVVLYDANTPV